MSRRRFTKQDWVALGLEELSAKGPEAIKLEAICSAANLTRGSFYHHFDDHDTFLMALADAWLATQTTEVAEVIDPTTPPARQSEALTEAAMQIDYRLELGIRELGRRIPAIDQIIRQADAIRLEVITTLYQRRFDLDRTMAEDLAFIEYAAFSGIILLDPSIDAARQKTLAALFDKTISRALDRNEAS